MSHKAKVGRPKVLDYSKRTIIQVDDAQLDAIRAIKGTMSMSQFFRIAAQHMLDNPHIISGKPNEI